MNDQKRLEKSNGDDKPLLDGLIVCTPTFTHKDVIQEAAAATTKRYQLDVFIEKPVGETSTEIEYLYQVAKDAQILLCCSFQRRFDVSYVHAANVVRNGEIGNPLLSHIFFADHPVPSKSFLLTGGNIFMDLAAHVSTDVYTYSGSIYLEILIIII